MPDRVKSSPASIFDIILLVECATSNIFLILYVPSEMSHQLMGAGKPGLPADELMRHNIGSKKFP